MKKKNKTTQKKIILILLCIIVTTHNYAMENISPDNIKKIMACCDPQSRKNFRLTCHDILKIKTQDFIHHSPLILSRADHKFYMVHAAQTNNEFLMKNLINNAIRCKHKDALDLLLNFIPQEVTNFQNIDFYNRYISLSENRIIIEGDLDKDIIAVLKKGNKKTEKFFSKNNNIKVGIAKRRHKMFQDVHSFFPQIMALYKADKTIMDQYICTMYDLKKAEYIITRKITPLQVAACFNSVAMVELLLLNGHEKQINDADIQGNTPLYLTNDTNVAAMLLQCKNIQANKQSKEGKTPLYKAVCQNKQPLIDLFLAHPHFIINEEDENQLTPLHTAARLGDKIAFEFFFKHSEGKVRNTTKPIHYAASFGHLGPVNK